MRLLGVDFGFERIGLAVGESELQIVSPRPVLAAAGGLKRDAEAIAKLAKTEEIDEIVVGCPLEEDGVEGRMAKITRQLAGHLEAHGYTVHLVDESMTSVAADRTMMDAGLKASERRKRRDSEAACLIIERFIHGEATLD